LKLFNRNKKKDPKNLTWRDVLAFSAIGNLFGIDESRHLSSSAVYACVKVISEGIAQIPMFVYHKNDKVREVAVDHKSHWMLHHKPSDIQTPYELKEWIMLNLLLNGNAYLYKVMVNGQVAELQPLDFSAVRVEAPLNLKKPNYYVRQKDGSERKVHTSRMWHIKGQSFDNVTGVSPLSYHRETVGLDVIAKEHAATTFSNAAKPAGIIKHPGNFKDPEARRKFGEAFKEAVTGKNAYGTIVLEDGMEYQPISISAKDSQYIEGRSFGRTEIAAIFGVPPHLVGDLTNANYSNIVEESLRYVVKTLGPWISRIEQSATLSLLTEDEIKKGYYVKFKVDALLRGDMDTRSKVYATYIQNGVMNPNEVRALEEMNPRDGGDEYLALANLMDNEEPKSNEESNKDDE